MSNQYNLTYTTDLNQGAASVILPMLFLYDDSNAHVFTVKTTRDGKANSLAGASVHAYFMPSNSEECVYIAGSVDSNGYAVVTLEPACYAFIGRFSLVIRAEMGDAVTSIFRGEGHVGQSHTDAILDPGNALPSLAALEARINALDAAKAPAGYGLGGTVYNQNIVAHIQNADQLNTATKCGWYACAFGDGGGAYTLFGVTMWNAVLFVSSYIDSRLCQELYATQQGVKFIRWCYNGTWTEWECVNPPMALGVEYRTTERWQGKAVYTKLIDCGALPNATEKTISHGTSASAVLRVTGTASNGMTLPFKRANGRECVIALSTNAVVIYSATDLSAYTATAQIWYVKD